MTRLMASQKTEVRRNVISSRPSSIPIANRSSTRQVSNGLTHAEAERIKRAARIEITRELGPLRSWPPNMRPESILARHEADAEAIERATNRVVGRLYEQRRKRQEQVRYHRSKLQELIGP